MAYSKSTDTITNNSPSFWKEQSIHEQAFDELAFINHVKKVADYLVTIEQQLEQLKLQYDEYTNSTCFHGGAKIDEQIEKELETIYKNGSAVMKILKKINPDTIFGFAKLPKGKRAGFQLHYDASSRHFKTLWVILYDLKQAHKTKKLAFTKLYTQAAFPNAKEEEVT